LGYISRERTWVFLSAQKQDLTITLHTPTNMSIFRTRAISPDIWLFPPNQTGGGNN